MTLYVSEYSQLGLGAAAQIPQEPPLAEYTVASGARGPAFQVATRFVRVSTDGASAMQVAFGPSATVTIVAGNQRLPINSTEYKGVPSNSGLAVAATNVA